MMLAYELYISVESNKSMQIYLYIYLVQLIFIVISRCFSKY